MRCFCATTPCRRATTRGGPVLWSLSDITAHHNPERGWGCSPGTQRDLLRFRSPLTEYSSKHARRRQPYVRSIARPYSDGAYTRISNDPGLMLGLVWPSAGGPSSAVGRKTLWLLESTAIVRAPRLRLDVGCSLVGSTLYSPNYSQGAFAVGSECESKLQIERCSIGAFPGRRRSHSLASLFIHDQHLAVATHCEQVTSGFVDRKAGMVLRSRSTSNARSLSRSWSQRPRFRQYLRHSRTRVQGRCRELEFSSERHGGNDF